MNVPLRRYAPLLLVALFIAPVWSDDAARAGKSDISISRAHTTPSFYQQLTDPNKVWFVDGAFGVEHDNNINHLLPNLAINSNDRLQDTILDTHALIGVSPSFFGKELQTEFSYAYDRYDFVDNTAFSYYNHALNMDLYPRITPTLRLDVGSYFDWSGDSSGIFADDQGMILGIEWRAPLKIKVKTGYEFRNDDDRVDGDLSAHSNIYYLSATRSLTRTQSVYIGYRFRDNEADGADFTYHANSLRVGWADHLTDWFRTSCLVSYLDKPYTNVDDRFLMQRHDRTFALTLKPIFMIAQGVDVILAWSWLKNNSNVDIKDYVDQIYSATLEGRF